MTVHTLSLYILHNLPDLSFRSGKHNVRPSLGLCVRDQGCAAATATHHPSGQAHPNQNVILENVSDNCRFTQVGRLL